MVGINVEKPSENKLKKLKIDSWIEGHCGVFSYDWFYANQEVCYIQKGRVLIRTAYGEEIELKKGDLVTFDKGVMCTWDIKEPVQKLSCF